MSADLPDYMKTINGPTKPPSASDLATTNVLQLNVSMFALYDYASQAFRRNILAKHPVILALFTGAGGRMILYRPGQTPIEGPSVPVRYQVMKSLGHSSMAVSEVVMPYLNNEKDKTWVAPMQGYLSQMKTALEGIGAVDMPADWLPTARAVLDINIAYMEDCLKRGAITMDALQAYATKLGPHMKRVVHYGASTQVAHWMGVLDEWQTLVGGSFDTAYAASNTIYVARQNNVLFSVLAQYFRPKAMNDRLLLIETISFTTSPDELLTSMTRIIADRSVGELFFKSYHLMDYELMGGDARKTIVAEMKKRGKEPYLPPMVPYGSNQWPTLITPGPGPTSLDDL